MAIADGIVKPTQAIRPPSTPALAVPRVIPVWLLAGAEQLLYDTVRDLLPGEIEISGGAWRTEYLYSRAATIYGGTAEVQRNIIARRLLELGKE